MGLRSDLQSDIAAAFDDDLADGVSTFVLRKVTSTFNTATNSTSETTADTSSRGVFLRYRTRELKDSDIEPKTYYLIVLQNELAVIPEIDDLVIVESTIYKVFDIKKDPAKATWVIRCRA